MKRYLRTFANREAARQFASVGLIGVFNTFVDFAAFNVLRSVTVPRNWAIVSAFAFATFVSYLLNRRWTFRIRAGSLNLRETVNFYVINLLALLVTLGVVELIDAVFGPLDLLGENIAKVAAVVVVLLPKFASYRDVVFRRALAGQQAAGEPVEAGDEWLSGDQTTDPPQSAQGAGNPPPQS